MGKAIRASVLILLLACSARAGWMPNDSPAPPPVSAAQGPTTGGDNQHPQAADDSGASVALSLLRAVLALF